MSLKDRLAGKKSPESPVQLVSDIATTPLAPPPQAAAKPWFETRTQEGGTVSSMHRIKGSDRAADPRDAVKVELHRKLVEQIDLKALEQIKDERLLDREIRGLVADIMEQDPVAMASMSAADRDDITKQVLYEITGLGPLEPLFSDPTISDILINGPKVIYVERRGQLELADVTFRNDAHVLAIIDRIVSKVGRRIDEASPMVDARLPDGSRVNAIIPPLALDGPVLCIRRFGSGLSMSSLVEKGAVSARMAMLLQACVMARLNILVSGGTGSGKTTMLNALASFVPHNQRIITIEDAAELRLQQPHVVRLETRPPNSEDQGEVSARALVKNALRMRPDRIIIGEVRSDEALDMLQAMNTGHEGSLSTVHANTPRDAMSRLETMIMMASASLPVKAIREQISSALDLLVQVSRMADGRRRVTSITEVTGMEGDVITSQEIYHFRRRGVDSEGNVLGEFGASGIRPKFNDRLMAAGIDLPSDMFEEMS